MDPRRYVLRVARLRRSPHSAAWRTTSSTRCACSGPRTRCVSAGRRCETTGGYEIFIDAAPDEAVFSLRPADNSKVVPAQGRQPQERRRGEPPRGHRHAERATCGSRSTAAPTSASDANRSAAESTGAHPRRHPGRRAARRSPAERLPATWTRRRSRADECRSSSSGPATTRRSPRTSHRLLAARHPELAVADRHRRRPRGRAAGGARPLLPRRSRRLRDPGRRGTDPRAARPITARRSTASTSTRRSSDVRRVRVGAGEVLSRRSDRSPPSSTWPTGPGLQVQPGGGYAAASVTPWVPVGHDRRDPACGAQRRDHRRPGRRRPDDPGRVLRARVVPAVRRRARSSRRSARRTEA